MAEDQNENKIVVSDEDAAKLLNDGTGSQDSSNDDSDANKSGDSVTEDTKDWKVEAEKWKKLSRKNESDFKTTAAKLKEFEDQNKSESDKLLEARDTFKSQAEKSSSELNRYRIAMDAAPDGPIDRAALAKVLKRLRGDTDEALEEDAKELWEDFSPASGGSTSVAGKPKEKLDRPRGGSNPDEEADEMNPAKLAALVPRAR